MKWCFNSLAISPSRIFDSLYLPFENAFYLFPESLGQGTYDSLTHCKICPESRVCQNFLPGATRTHRPLPLTELNTACFRESPPTDFGQVPRSVNPVILCHWHNELNTSKYHFQKQKQFHFSLFNLYSRDNKLTQIFNNG